MEENQLELKFRPVAIVVWENTSGIDPDWKTVEECKRKTVFVTSVGFVFGETSDSITIAPHVKEEIELQMAGSITIPKRQIVSMREARWFKDKQKETNESLQRPDPAATAGNAIGKQVNLVGE